MSPYKASIDVVPTGLAVAITQKLSGNAYEVAIALNRIGRHILNHSTTSDGLFTDPPPTVEITFGGGKAWIEYKEWDHDWKAQDEE